MAGKPEHGGLCSTCIHDGTCTFPRDPARPVVRCEEFDAGPPARGRKGRSVRGPSRRPVVAPDLNEGICCTCSNRKDCTYPRARKGVQRCEEYA